MDLFKQNVGYETDVSKEMFTWEDHSNQQIALKPEMTAPVVRAILRVDYIEAIHCAVYIT